MQGHFQHSPHEQPRIDWVAIEQVFRGAAMIAGVALVLVGLWLAVTAFMLIRDTVRTPHQLAGLLDSWEQALATRQPSGQPNGPAAAAETPTTADEASAPAAAPAGDERRPAPSGGPWVELLHRFIATLQQAGVARPVGALFLLLFMSMLVRIPFGLTAAGTSLLVSLLTTRSRDRAAA